MATKDAKLDRDEVTNAYNAVRDNNDPITWAVFKYGDGNLISTAATGTEYDEFLTHFTDDERVYGFLRLETGDELSKRAKFAFVAWIGEDVGALKKAKVSTDKAIVKSVVASFAAEILTSERSDLRYDTIFARVKKAGGADYNGGR
ncbi:hypothetical protein CAOG_08639 [Capsaspora owczarzaki ATCC 30864]|uniref:ADF-H domain-containing protein n=1 Tax=Capsaspora owczarzaki (strain ATCC 30864) TaxID=595528 RepID=A0A0D2WN54_CAPO3|nr:hypothetical protein CAOG_08639 [Capsaspora owczarzaki ATCC 30864]KJE91758.1 hypothetical protein CAOG_008639 [Capsaspora owczarzaki ATCC 30864]|eukprot:XP_011270250.1 hypothetical protein CAOG_08639 [Capsaspora owczarzaki ATCC 30864]